VLEVTLPDDLRPERVPDQRGRHAGVGVVRTAEVVNRYGELRLLTDEELYKTGPPEVTR
jgi:hypothetical protein